MFRCASHTRSTAILWWAMLWTNFKNCSKVLWKECWEINVHNHAISDRISNTMGSGLRQSVGDLAWMYWLRASNISVSETSTQFIGPVVFCGQCNCIAYNIFIYYSQGYVVEALRHFALWQLQQRCCSAADQHPSTAPGDHFTSCMHIYICICNNVYYICHRLQAGLDSGPMCACWGSHLRSDVLHNPMLAVTKHVLAHQWIAGKLVRPTSQHACRNWIDEACMNAAARCKLLPTWFINAGMNPIPLWLSRIAWNQWCMQNTQVASWRFLTYYY